jgi:hypothetical protein
MKIIRGSFSDKIIETFFYRDELPDEARRIVEEAGWKDESFTVVFDWDGILDVYPSDW